MEVPTISKPCLNSVWERVDRHALAPSLAVETLGGAVEAEVVSDDKAEPWRTEMVGQQVEVITSPPCYTAKNHPRSAQYGRARKKQIPMCSLLSLTCLQVQVLPRQWMVGPSQSSLLTQLAAVGNGLACRASCASSIREPSTT